MNTSDHFEEQDDLDWLAFQYVADELDEAERAAFESRLADDTVASEAVVAAMKLAQQVDYSLRGSNHHSASTVSGVNGDTPVQPQSLATETSSRFSLPLAIAASIAALLFGWWTVNQSQTDSIDTHGPVAIAWASDFDDETVDDIQTEDWGTSLVDSPVDDNLNDELLVDSDDEWLLVALVDIENPNLESVE